MRKNNDILSFYLLKGNLEILKYLEKNSPMQFKDLRNLTNPNTTKKFSSKTVAARLKDLESTGNVINEIINIKNKRKSVGYTITEKGKKTLEIIRETQTRFEKLEQEK